MKDIRHMLAFLFGWGFILATVAVHLVTSPIRRRQRRRETGLEDDIGTTPDKENAQ